MAKQEKFIEFTKNKKHLVYRWWNNLPRYPDEKAYLRKCQDIYGIASSFYYKQLRNLFIGNESAYEPQLLVTAGVLAHVEVDIPENYFSLQMKEMSQSDKDVAQMQDFEELLELEERNDLFLPLVENIILLNRKANVAELAESIFFWGDEVREKWREYFYGQ